MTTISAIMLLLHFGMLKIKNEGGLTIVQSPEDSEIQTMPLFCINMFQPDHIFDAAKIVNFIKNL